MTKKLVSAEETPMTEKEQATLLMDIYTNLQRIKNAPDRDREIDYQIRATRAKLEVLGIVTTDLEMDRE